MWPKLKAKSAESKGRTWAESPVVKLAIEAVREAAVDRIRAEYLENDCGLTDIIKLITARLKDRETPAREFKELAIYALDMQGHAPKKTKERPTSDNALANTQAAIAAAAGFGAAAGASLADGRLPPVHEVFPQDTHEGTRDTAVHTLAPPGTDVAGPHGPDSTQ
jgi:hypothetical protein